MGGGIISSTVKVKDGSTPEAGNTCLMQAVQLRCHGTGIITSLCATTFLCSLSHAYLYFSLFVSILPLHCAFEQRQENVLIVLHDWVPSSHLTFHNTHRHTVMSYEHPFWAPMHIRLSCIPGKEEKEKINDKTCFNYQQGLDGTKINSLNDAVFFIHIMADGCRR